MTNPVQTYTVLIKNELIELRASTPTEAAKLAADKHRLDNGWLEHEDMGSFVELTVFVGKAPECLYNSCGVYAV